MPQGSAFLIKLKVLNQERVLQIHFSFGSIWKQGATIGSLFFISITPYSYRLMNIQFEDHVLIEAQAESAEKALEKLFYF